MLIHKYCKNNKGLSLVELLIGMVILLIVLAPLPGILRNTSDSFLYNMAQTRNISGEQAVFNAIADEVRYANSMNTSVAGRITYTVSVNVHGTTLNQTRRIFTEEADNARSLVLERTDPENVNNITTTRIAIGALNNQNPILFNWNAATRTLTVSISLNDNSYTNSPTMNYNDRIIILQNM